jgi:diguanylate cyclase (GGDEF)-like protein
VSKESKFTTVLLVDDDRQVYLLIGYLLSEVQKEDYRLVWCQNPDKAIEQIERSACDVVLLDYHWGGARIGHEFLDKAKVKNNRIPIIVMTDEVEADIDERAILEGASDYLTKSRINSQVLERAIRYSIDRKKIEDRLDHLAHYDHLTDLPNRSLFVDRLRHSINIAYREKHTFTLMFIDLDNFKGINDSYGHDVGDKLLTQFARRLGKVVRRSDTIARIGGDEFTVLLHNIGSRPKIIMLAQKIIDETSKPYSIDGHEFVVNCSIGIAIYPESGADEETLQRNADLAMYEAKQEHVSSYRFFTDVLTQDIKMQWDLHRDYYNAMKKREFGVFYIPRINLKTKKLAAIEIAPYWKHPTKGVLHYQYFSSISKDKEKGKVLFNWLFAMGLHQFSRLHNKQDVKLVFNVDIEHFAEPDFIKMVRKILEDAGPISSCIEINFNQPETNPHNFEVIETYIDNLSSLGVSFGLNGFGGEFSSLLHLKSLPVTTLKLDKRLINTAHIDINDAMLVEAIIHFAHELKKVVVAEGVHTKAQAIMLEKLDCDQGKGQAVQGVMSFKQLYQYLLEQQVEEVSD